MTDQYHPMIEKAARAAEREFGMLSFCVDENEARAIVIAVLRVLREPDEGMVAAMYDVATNRLAITYGDAFTAAIDSILPEEKGRP